MPMTVVEEAARERIRRAFGGERLLTIGRTAILTRAHDGRAACHYCGVCERGCVTRSYFSSLNSTLPAARRTGRLTLRPHSVVERVLLDPRRRRVRGVRVIDALDGRELEFEARVVFLCASALESTRLLLHSATEEFPTGLADSSGTLGQGLMDHTFAAGAAGTMPGFEDRATFGRRPTGCYVPRFRNVSAAHPAFVRGYAFQAYTEREGWERGASLPGFGAAFKGALERDLGPWRFTLRGFGEMLPEASNRVELDPVVRDRWGIPALRITCRYGPNELAQLRDVQTAAAELLEAAGATDVRPFRDDLLPGLCVHEMGTARMGRDPRTSVLDAHNRAHDLPNLFLTDGACMASSANQNPSLTYMALTARACAFAVEAMKRREL
jgi:choline dehydrogenase-like flavoprotein